MITDIAVGKLISSENLADAPIVMINSALTLQGGKLLNPFRTAIVLLQQFENGWLQLPILKADLDNHCDSCGVSHLNVNGCKVNF